MNLQQIGGMMNAVVSKSDFLDAVQSISSILPTRSAMPVYGFVLLSAKGKKIEAVGTDRDQTLYVEIPAEIFAEGSFAVSAKKLTDVIREFGDGEINISLEDYRLLISQGELKVRLSGVQQEDFPKTEIISSPGKPISIDTKTFQELISLVEYAMAKDIAKISLAGLLCQIFPDELRMVATEGHMLAMVRKPAKFKVEERIEILIPDKAVQKLLSLLNKTRADKVKLTPGKGSIELVMGNNRFQTRLIAEKFPDYEAVIPKNNPNIMIVDKQNLLDTLRLMMNLATPLTNLVRFDISPNKVEISAKDLDAGTEGHNAISVEYTGEKMSIGFNCKMLTEIIKNIPSEQVRFEIAGSINACLIMPVTQPADFEYTAVIMPLRLPD